MTGNEHKSNEELYYELTEKVGGRFRLTVLIQKRLKEINRGAKPLVQVNTDNNTRVVLEEIYQDLIHLEEGIEFTEEAARKTGKE